MKDQKDFSYKKFVEMFVHPIVSLLSGTKKPRINEDIKRIMQLSNQDRTGYWYLYQNYTKIRVYGCGLAPYNMQKFLPMRVFALEYIK